jgi:hypothetical protein
VLSEVEVQVASLNRAIAINIISDLLEVEDIGGFV